MIIVQFVDEINTSKLPVDIIQTFRHNTYLLDCQLNEHDYIRYITNNFKVLSIQDNNDCAYIDVYERHTASYTTVLAEDTLAPIIEKLDLLQAQQPHIICFSWQMDRNYILDYR